MRLSSQILARALHGYIQKEGRFWKKKLKEAFWTKNFTGYEKDVHHLVRLRNTVFFEIESKLTSKSTLDEIAEHIDNAQGDNDVYS